MCLRTGSAQPITEIAIWILIETDDICYPAVD
jgi:hypothetical protein